MLLSLPSVEAQMGQFYRRPAQRQVMVVVQQQDEDIFSPWQRAPRVLPMANPVAIETALAIANLSPDVQFGHYPG